MLDISDDIYDDDFAEEVTINGTGGILAIFRRGFDVGKTTDSSLPVQSRQDNAEAASIRVRVSELASVKYGLIIKDQNDVKWTVKRFLRRGGEWRMIAFTNVRMQA